MSWAKVQQPWQKPLKFWYHKILCELGYNIGGSTHPLYHYHLKKILRMKFNLYGEKSTCKPVRPIDLSELLTPDQDSEPEMLIDRAWRELTSKLP